MTEHGPRSARARGATPRIGYIMSRFPKLTETFVLYEMLMMERLGASVEIYPLRRERQPVAHPETEALVSRSRFHPFLSLSILRAHGYFLRRRPSAYLRALKEALAGTLGSRRFFLGALVYFPKSVRFAYEMAQSGVSHVHAHFATHPAVAALIVHRLTGIPFSFTAHGSDLHVDRTMLREKTAAAAFAVTVSEFNRQVMIDACGEAAREKVEVVHCGVEVESFRTAEKRDPGAPLQLITVASFEEVKGHDVLVDACRILKERGVRFHCRLVGEGPRRRAVEARIAALGLEAEVELLGARSRPEVIRLLASSDVAVLASVPTRSGKREGIPVALMEAMAAELPVVASRLSGIPELVEDERTGLLFAPGDAEALARAVERLGGSGERRRSMGKAGRQRVAAEFDLKANARKLLQRMSALGSPIVTAAESEKGARGVEAMPVAEAGSGAG